MFSMKKVVKFTFSFLFYLCSNLLYFPSTLSEGSFFLSDGESYLLFKYIWFTYVFSTDKGSFSSFITKAPNMLKNPVKRQNIQ